MVKRRATPDTIVRVTPTAAEGPSDQNAAVAASFLGWALDAFDYFLVVYGLTAIARDFHRSDKDMALAITVTLAFRPLGAFLFGLLADRYGRRTPLMADLVFYSVIEVATAFAPTYTSFLVLRALFGIGMGGEWGVGASLAMEKVPPRLRGVLSGLLQQGYALGNLLAALCYFFLFQRWGWRPMFLLGGLPALLALFVRVKVKESEAWERTKSANWGQLWASVFSNWRIFLYIALLMTFMNFSSHGTQDMYPTFLQRYFHFDSRKRTMISAISSVGAIAGGIFFGFLSDRIGRRRSIVMALILAVLVVPLWAFSPTTATIVAGAFLMQFMVQGAWGVIPAHLSELAPDSVRSFLPGFAYQCGVLISGSIVYVQAFLAETMSYASTMAVTGAAVFLGGAVVTALGREHRGRRFGE
jgi:SHS family lactate transporter-like MFS transporter